MGLYDRIDNVFGKNDSIYEIDKEKKCRDSLKLTTKKYLRGLESFLKIIHDVTEKVCKSLCLHYASKTCNAALYNFKMKKCYLTRITKDTFGASLIDSNTTNYFERERCNGELFLYLNIQ